MENQKALDLLQPLLDLELKTVAPKFAEKYHTQRFFHKRVTDIHEDGKLVGHGIFLDVLHESGYDDKTRNPIHIEAMATESGFVTMSCMSTTQANSFEYRTKDVRFNNGEPRPIKDVLNSFFKEVNDEVKHGNYREHALDDGFYSMHRFVEENIPHKIENLRASVVYGPGGTDTTSRFELAGKSHEITTGVRNNPVSAPFAYVRHIVDGNQYSLQKIDLNPEWSANKCYETILDKSAEGLIKNMREQLGLSLVDDLDQEAPEL